jgi:hypothetical protein
MQGVWRQGCLWHQFRIHPHHPLSSMPGLKPPESAPRMQLVPRDSNQTESGDR